MNLKTPARFLLLSAAAVALVTGCTTPPPPPPPPEVVIIPPPPPPPPPPPVALSTRVIELASTYRAVMGGLGAIAPTFTDATTVSNAVRIGSAYEPEQTAQGAIAYAAIAALQEPNFVASVRENVVDAASRQALVQRILINPLEASNLPNADRAAGLAIAALDGMGAKTTVSGNAVKQSAYDVQLQAWSKRPVADAAQRLAATKELSATPVQASIEDVGRLREASVGAAAMSLGGDPVNAPYTDTIARGLAVAALAALGAAGDENDVILTPLLTSQDDSGFCLNMAKLNLNQCLSVSRAYYEDIFCLGQHVMIDTGNCAIKAAGSPNPAYVEPPAPTRVAAAPAARPAARR